jgi:hypothetical protein
MNCLKSLLLFSLISGYCFAQSDTIVYHRVKLDKQGNILPWNYDESGKAYDDVLQRVWLFWKNIETDSNGQKYYMNHQVWHPHHDKRGLGGDQLMMALSSWDLYYNYTGDTGVLGNMQYMADYYLAHSLSPADSKWPNLPYPYNMDVESGIYDGDMILGKNYLQPDKAGSFGNELIRLYKKTNNEKYLDAAVKIANTLAEKVRAGDADNSPWPFKVNSVTGDTGVLVNQEVWYEGMENDVKYKNGNKKSSYTTFWTASIEMFSQLIGLKKGNVGHYRNAHDLVVDWMNKYPAKNNKWGPFFEDVPRWSDTQINGITYAMYLLEHPQIDRNWKQNASNIIKWVYDSLGNSEYKKYGVICINEQTAYRVPGNSHTARQAACDLLFAEKTGDTAKIDDAIRQLNWATYMVDDDGKNFYPTNAIWMTDGYGDYVRHYLRAMASYPQLAPEENHLLRTSSVIRKITYRKKQIDYTTFDGTGNELLKLTTKPASVTGAAKWTWKELKYGGVITISRKNSKHLTILF